MNIEHIYNICEELKSTSGRLDKEAILKREKDNEEWKQFLVYVFDKNLVYGLQDKKIKKYLGKTEDNDNQLGFKRTLSDVFEYLKVNNTGTDKDAQKVAYFIDNQDEKYQQFLIDSITKKLRLGIEKTIQKIYPDLIEKFEVMRGKSYHDYKDKIKGKSFILTEKMNGIRCITIKNGDSIIHKSRQNKVIEGLDLITDEMRNLKDGVYDGELVIKNYQNYKLRDVLQQTMKIVNSDDKVKVVDYWIFDHLTHDEFQEKVTSRKYFERRDSNPLQDKQLEHVKLIPELYRGNDSNTVDELLGEVVNRGGEGLMLNFDLPFKTGKTNNILKCKKKYTSDVKLIGFEEGNGKYKGKLGALILDYKGFPLGCSGMTDELRVEIWNNQDKYLGVIVEIEHEQESQNEKGGLSVEYPSFVRFRFDKDEVSYAHD